jgi:hypothetical protein
MTTSSKVSFITAAIAVIATGAALADDPQLQNRLALERAQRTPASRTTVAVYANERGVGRVNSLATSAETRFELRSNPHGQTYGVFVSGH